MHVSRVYLRWYKSFNVDYTGSAGGDRVITHRPWNLWKQGAIDIDFPFVEIALEKDITTIVGANESGKSQLLSAIRMVLLGRSIPSDPYASGKADGKEYSETDLCHFTPPRTKNASLWPQLGLELSGLTRDDFIAITGVDPSSTASDFNIKLFLMPSVERVGLIYHNHSEVPRELTDNDLKQIRARLPRVHFIDSQLPFADEVNLADLLRGYNEGFDTRNQFYDSKVAQDVMREMAGLMIPAPSPQPASAEFMESLRKLQHKINDSSQLRAKQLQLEVKLFRDVLGIKAEALKHLYNLKDDDKSHGDALVATWTTELERVLNLSRYWQQDQDFSVKLRHYKGVISFEIWDKTQKSYTFKERSSGLRYFLSYYIQAKALEQTSKGVATIILMDEPDSFLSIAGQRNLLAVFESLVRSHGPSHFQLVYTTHSPFLINRNFPRRIRLVRKGDGEEGTQLVDKARERRFEPIRSALGIELSQTLFMGATNVVTEGSTDQYFISEAIRVFSPEVPASEMISLNDVIIVSGESASGIYKLISASKWADEPIPNAVVLLDNDDAGKIEVRRLTGNLRNTPKLLDSEFIISTGDVLDSTASDSTTEDIVPTRLFVRSVNRYVDHWFKISADEKEGLLPLLSVATFESNGHVNAARAVFNAVRGTEDTEFDKLGVFEELFALLEDDKADAVKSAAKRSPDATTNQADRKLLRDRIVRLCYLLRSRIESGSRAERQQTGVQAVKRLINDFLLLYQGSPPATLDVELKIGRLISEARSFGAEDGNTLLLVLSAMSLSLKALRQDGRVDMSWEDWGIWKAKLEAITKNPLSPVFAGSDTGVPPTTAVQIPLSTAVITQALAAQVVPPLVDQVQLQPANIPAQVALVPATDKALIDQTPADYGVATQTLPGASTG